MGYATTASGLNAVALGFNTLAAGSITTALGSNTTATGDFGTSMGYSTIANCGATEPSNWQACVAMGFNINNTESESLAVSGNMHARNVKLFGNDERFKENITNANVETCLFNINKIRVVNYQLSKNVCKHQGFMAKDMLDKCQQELIGITSQQVGSILPNAIGSGISSLKLVDRSPSFNNNKSQEDQHEEILEDIHDVKGLDMNQIIAQLIGSIQTLSKQNEKLINLNELNYNISLPNNDGRNVLHEASIGGYLSIVRFLIEDFHMDVCAIDGSTNGKSVTYLSAFYGKIDVVKYLLEKGGDLNDKKEGIVDGLGDHYGVDFRGESVALSGRNRTDGDASAIGDLLKTNNTLKKLYLGLNNITDVQSIGEGLKTNLNAIQQYKKDGSNGYQTSERDENRDKKNYF
eukprot:g9031.t1